MNNTFFPAHIKNEKPYTAQSCQSHCVETANYAKEDLANIGLGAIAYLSGLMHDCGKFNEEFKDYITKAARRQDVRKGSVIHSFAGVYYILSKHHRLEDQGTYRSITAEIIASAIGSHHGLFDCVGQDGENGFLRKLKTQPEKDEHSINNYLSYFKNERDLGLLFESAVKEVMDVFSKLEKAIGKTKQEQKQEELLFYLGLLTRLITSSVIDGDRKDTALFYGKGISLPSRGTISETWQSCSDNLESQLSNFEHNTKIQKARKEISDICKDFACNKPGIYRLNVPTGGGKTLSSMRFAFRHALAYRKSRIIYAAPFVSIIEQNAKAIREATGDDKLVLEHHSNIIKDKSGEGEEALSQYDVLTTIWDSPIIVTTLVQLLNALFSGKTSSIRRFQSLSNSIIIIDEVQSVPFKMLTLFNLALNFLNEVMGATIILCSATQPSTEDLDHSLHVSKSKFLNDVAFKKYEEVFKRTELVIHDQPASLKSISSFAKKLLKEAKSLLIVCNTKAEASFIFNEMKKGCDNCFCLSSAMCPAHRKDVLTRLYASLEDGRKTICVSTQVIEAGVDISFRSVIRLTAGIDNITQTAGRCNRNGEISGLAPVHIFDCQDEKLGRLNEIKAAQDAACELFYHYKRNPEEFDNSLDSEKSIDFYYKRLYRLLKSEHVDCFDFPINGTTIFKLISDNTDFVVKSKEAESYTLRQAFKTAGQNFEVIEQNTETIIVPYGEEGQEVISMMLTSRAEHDITYLNSLLNKAKSYSVSIHENQLSKLIKQNAIKSKFDERVLILDSNYYNKDTGLQTIPTEGDAIEWNTLTS